MSGRTDIFKPATKPYWVSQRERAATRDVLIGVARDLVERDGVPALTLGAVADQAGMARATVYGFFSGRSELLRALERRLPVPEPQAAPETDGAADSDSSSAIWINCQPDLNDFLPEDASPEEGAAEEPPPAQETEPAAVVPDQQSTQPDAPIEADTSEDWVVFETPAAPAAAEVCEVPEPEVAAAEPPPAVSEPAESASDIEPDAQSHAAVAAEPVEEPQPVTEPAASDAEVAVHDEPAEESDAIESAAPPADEPEPVAQASQQMQAGPAEEQLDILAGQEERRRQQAAHLDEIAKRLILPESAIRDGTDAVIARLDTRIRVLEKSIAGLETRQNTAEADGGRKIKPVADRVEQLFARADGADAKTAQDRLRASPEHPPSRDAARSARGAASRRGLRRARMGRAATRTSARDRRGRDGRRASGAVRR